MAYPVHQPRNSRWTGCGEAKDTAWCSTWGFYRGLDLTVLVPIVTNDFQTLIQGATLKSFEVTATTCVPGDAAQRENTSIDGREATFKTTDGNVFFIRSGGTADHRLLHNVSSVSDVRIDRIAKLPVTCEHPTPNTPQGNFEVFTRTWAENYILFDQQKADWDATVAANRAKITDKTTPAELFDILAGMIEPFHNLHTYIDAPISSANSTHTGRVRTVLSKTTDMNSTLRPCRRCWQLPIARISKRHYASGATTRCNTPSSMRPRDICVSSPSPAIPRSGGLRTD
jgi:hypothetical protein